MDFERLENASLAGLDYPPATWGHLRERPVFWSERYNAWVVTQYDEAKKVYADHRNFSNEDTGIAEAFGPTAMLFSDGSLHNTLRAVWAREMLPAAVEGRMELFSRIARELLAPVVERLRAGETVELIDVIKDFTIDAIAALMDVPTDRRDDFKRWNTVISQGAVMAIPHDDPRFKIREDTKAEVYAFLQVAIDNRVRRIAAGEAPEDFITMMVRAVGKGGITDRMVADNSLNLFLGAYDTTVRWLGNIVQLLHRFPEVRAELVANPALRPQAYEEMMRFQPVVQNIVRIVRHDGVTIAGQPVAKGAQVFLLNGVANLDEQAFEAADRLDIHRPARMNLGFGFGIHQCIGQHAARAEARAFMDQLFREVPDFEVVDGEYDQPWYLWGPTTLHVRLPGAGAR